MFHYSFPLEELMILLGFCFRFEVKSRGGGGGTWVTFSGCEATGFREHPPLEL